jgi:hypothetical protein
VLQLKPKSITATNPSPPSSSSSTRTFHPNNDPSYEHAAIRSNGGTATAVADTVVIPPFLLC